MITSELVESLVLEYLGETDYFLVDAAVSPSNRITVEIDRNEGVPIDYCVSLSRFIESKLDREEEDYELEVASATLGQPFKVYRQYLKNLGMDVSVLTVDGIKENGVLVDVREDGISVEILRKVLPEGKKRKVEVAVREDFEMEKIKEVRNIIKFK